MCGVAGSYQQADGKVVVNAMIDRLGHRGPDACGVLELVDPETGGRPGAPAPVDHRPVDGGGPAAGQGRPDAQLQRRALQLPRAQARARGQGRPVHHELGHRGRARGVAGLGDGRAPALPRDVRLRDPRRAHRQPHAGPRPARHQAALHDAVAAAGVVFASELKAIVAAVGTELSVDPAAMVASTLYYWLPPQHDAVRGVQKLPPGSWTEYRRDGSSVSAGVLEPVRGGHPGRERPAGGPAGDHRVLGGGATSSPTCRSRRSSAAASTPASSPRWRTASTPRSRPTRSPSGPRTSASRRCPTTPHYARKMAAHLGDRAARDRDRSRTWSTCCRGWSTSSTSRSATPPRSTPC